MSPHIDEISTKHEYTPIFSMKNIKQNLLFTSFQFYLVPFFYYLSYIADEYVGSIWVLLTIVFYLVPLLDNLLSFDARNPTPEQQKKLRSQLRFKLPLYICVFSDWIFTYYILKKLTNYDYNFIDKIGWIAAAGVFAASNINVAHQLIHKQADIIDYSLGSFTLSKNLYMHFIPEHLHGHHKYVATPLDPASARKGQILY